jgi:hypothetical protein
MKTIAIDIKEKVFNNDTEAIMYVTKDNEGVDPTYVFAIPVISFSWQAENEKQLERFFPMNIFGDKEREKRLLHEMKASIKRFD